MEYELSGVCGCFGEQQRCVQHKLMRTSLVVFEDDLISDIRVIAIAAKISSVKVDYLE